MKTDERNKEIISLRSSGHTYKSIGDRFGISPARARQIVEKKERKLRAQEAKKREIPQNIYRYVSRDDFIPDRVFVNDGGFISCRWDCGNPLCTYVFGHLCVYEAIKCGGQIPVGKWADYCLQALTDISLADEARRGEQWKPR